MFEFTICCIFNLKIISSPKVHMLLWSSSILMKTSSYLFWGNIGERYIAKKNWWFLNFSDEEMDTVLLHAIFEYD